MKPKMYSIVYGEEKNIKKAKGMKQNAVKNKIKNKNYKECILGKERQ